MRTAIRRYPDGNPKVCECLLPSFTLLLFPAQINHFPLLFKGIWLWNKASARRLQLTMLFILLPFILYERGAPPCRGAGPNGTAPAQCTSPDSHPHCPMQIQGCPSHRSSEKAFVAIISRMDLVESKAKTYELCTIRSMKASAMVGSGISSYHSS